METEKIRQSEKETTNGTEKKFSLSAICVNKQQSQNNGSVIFGFNVSQNKDGQPTAQKTIEYKTTDEKEIEQFQIGSYYMITIT